MSARAARGTQERPVFVGFRQSEGPDHPRPVGGVRIEVPLQVAIVIVDIVARLAPSFSRRQRHAMTNE